MAILLSISASLFLGIVPMVAYALILWWLDRYEKEPLGLLVAAFLWGAVPAVIFSLITELVLHIPISYFVSPVAADLIGASVVAPLTEEVFKGAALVLRGQLHARRPGLASDRRTSSAANWGRSASRAA